MGNNQHLDQWERSWLEREISSAEASKMASNEDNFELLDKFVSASAGLKVEETTDHQQAWEKLEAAISQQEETKVIPIYRNYWLRGIAASLLLIAATFFILDPFAPNTIEIDTALAETEKVYLPDSSIIHLNAESKISYVSNNWDEDRIVELEGEAFFEVKRGSNFMVSTSHGTVEVLGTSFNVRSRGKQLIVACKTGKVRVTSFDKGTQQILTPGLQTRIKNNEVEVPEETNLGAIDSWRKGEYFLESVSIREGFEELERIFDLEVVHELPELELERPGNWDFDKNNLTESIQTITVTMGLTHRFEGNKIIFEKK
ncbi:FecR family protein [Roseivirga sp.]|uniref:FecR family protein n=1 Tax=Roseivirga sp. TaxID=1964215 RepID=UPI003B8BB6B1